jgi:hypothetical protein
LRWRLLHMLSPKPPCQAIELPIGSFIKCVENLEAVPTCQEAPETNEETVLKVQSTPLYSIGRSFR